MVIVYIINILLKDQLANGEYWLNDTKEFAKIALNMCKKYIIVSELLTVPPDLKPDSI